MPKIAFLIPYFGRFPDYFRFFIDSCKTNPHFEFFFFTDCLTDVSLPNVHFVNMTLTDFSQLATEKIGIPIALNKSYKLCDFKVAYGKIFEEYAKGFDFWGTCDVDIVLGDLKKFLNAETLADVDVYSGIKWYLSGSFFLFRNNEKINTLFLKSADYRKVFQSDKIFVFDECGPVWDKMKDGVDLFQLDTGVESITHVLLNKDKNEGLRLLFTDDLLEKTGGQKVMFHNGHLFMGEKEFLLLHFIYLKTTYYFVIPNWPIPEKGYFIDQWGIHQLDELQLINYLFRGNLFKIIQVKGKLLFKRLLRLDFIPSEYRT